MSGTDDALTEIFTSLEADLLEVGQLHPGRLHQRLGRGPSVALVEIGMQRPGVDPDADGHTPVLGLGGHLLDLRLLAEIAGVEPQPLDAGRQRPERHLVVEVDVGDDRHRRAGHDVGQSLGRLLLVARAAHDVGTGRGQGVDLAEGALDVGRLGRGHGLDGDGGVTPHGHRSDADLPGEPARGVRPVRAHWKGLAMGWAMSRKMAAATKTMRKRTKAYATGINLFTSARYGLPFRLPDPFVHGDENVAAVEREHGDQIDESDGDDDGGEHAEKVGRAALGRLIGQTDRPRQRDGPAVGLGRRIGRLGVVELAEEGAEPVGRERVPE